MEVDEFGFWVIKGHCIVKKPKRKENYSKRGNSRTDGFQNTDQNDPMHQNHLHKTNHKKTKKKLRPLRKNPTMTITITSENRGQAAETMETSYHPNRRRRRS